MPVAKITWQQAEYLANSMGLFKLSGRFGMSFNAVVAVVQQMTALALIRPSLVSTPLTLPFSITIFLTGVESLTRSL